MRAGRYRSRGLDETITWVVVCCTALACASATRAVDVPGAPRTSHRGANAQLASTDNERVVMSGIEDQSELPDDDEDDGEPAEAEPVPSSMAHPLDAISDSALRDAFHHQPESLGSISVGSPNAGRLINGVRPPESSLYHLVDPEHAWGTRETVNSLCHALESVAQQHPGTPRVDIGHLSARHGGPLRPHRSHQSGRDVDLGLYYSSGPTRWYTRSNGENLDVARTWTLIRVLATSTDIEMLLLDITLQKRIEAFALKVEPDPTWVHSLFHGSGARPALIRHSPGHATHIHLRFKNPVARRSAQRLAPLLAELRPSATVVHQTPSISHLARTGDTLQKLAQRYCTTMDAIRAANRMRGYQLKAGQLYVIPVHKAAGSNRPAECARSR